MIHLSAGELLRQEANDPTSEFASEIEPYLKAGTIVPVEITCSLLHKVIQLLHFWLTLLHNLLAHIYHSDCYNILYHLLASMQHISRMNAFLNRFSNSCANKK